MAHIELGTALEDPQVPGFLNKVQSDHGQDMHDECIKQIACLPADEEFEPIRILSRSRFRLEETLRADIAATMEESFGAS